MSEGRPRSRHGAERGQSAVEFALVLPVVLMAVWAIFEFGLAYGKLLDIQSATREGARRGSIAFNDTHAVTAAQVAVQRAVSLTDPKDLSITVTPAPSPSWEHGQLITVRTTTPWTIRVFGMPVWNGQPTSKAEARVE